MRNCYNFILNRFYIIIYLIYWHISKGCITLFILIFFVQESLEGYDGLTLVPAGFDITRLQTYRNEENHWHRKKSTRNEYLPHDDRTVSSSEEFLINNSHDQSSSSSDFFQIKPPKTSKTSSHSKRLTRPPSSLLRNETFKVPSVQKEEINILDQSVPSITNSDTLIKPLKCSPHLEESSFSRHDNVPTTTTERGGQGARYTSGYSDAVHHHSEISA